MRAEKKYLIDEVTGHLKKSDYVILTNFTKLTVADAAELRKRLSPDKAEFHVVKNSSFRVAAKAFGLPDLEKSLTGQTAVVVGGKNPAGVAKVLKKFIEEKQKLEVKVGVLDKKLMTAADLSKLADLPSFDALRSMFLGLLTMQGAAFVRVLDAKVKKEQSSASAA
ncbi:MAG: 50S ribosomal protein L10 [Opitutae bacterium]|jgi:large subunit ribosomal protein L10|nr:50S ribosomal protein L10 [Opitutae bacterium]NBX58925.1 50S ribosomal protein L10 [Opitutaceae bacterium]PAW87205.1 MAG: 50S ribosomal protein L10 [Opitutae bacterium Tous-C10FEB]